MQKIDKNASFIFFSALLFVNLVFDAYLYTLPNHTTIWNYLVNFTYGIIFILGGLNAIRLCFKAGFTLSSLLGKTVISISLGLISWGVGLQIWMYYNIFLHVAVPYPSVADFFLPLFYFFVALGTIPLIKLYAKAITPRIIAESIVIIIFFASIVFYVTRPDISTQLPFIIKFLNAFYPLGSAFLISFAVIILRISGIGIRKSLPFFIVGLALHAIASLIYGYQAGNNTYWNGGPVDLTMMFAVFFLSIGLVKIIWEFKSI